MANTVRLKRSAVQGKAPVVGDLSLGELAVNTYDGKLYMKKNDGSDAIVEIGGSITVSGTAPSSPGTGDLWYDTESARTFVYTGSEWADSSPDAGNPTVITSDSAPSSPQDGDLWFRTSDGRMYVYYDDGASSQWVDANPNLPVASDTFDRSGTTVSLVNSGDTVSLDGDLSAVNLTATKGTFSTGVLFGTDTAAANTLDDYEEGTWTPVYQGRATNGTTTNSRTPNGVYTKVGKQVTVMWDFAQSISGGSGDVQIGGLPFAATTGPHKRYSGSIIMGSTDLTWSGEAAVYLNDGNDYLWVVQNRSGQNYSFLTITGTNFESWGCITYFVD